MPGEARSDVIVALDGRELAGVASLQPSLAVEAGAEPDVLTAFLPHLASIGAGLLKVSAPTAETIWRALRRAGRRAVLDRFETAYALAPGDGARRADAGGRARAAARSPRDLEALVHAARASLREEHRPDPFEGDPDGFRRWVAGRIARATVVECAGALRFVGYADVQRAEGWLLQGVYTWPEARRRGLAAAGVAALCGAGRRRRRAPRPARRRRGQPARRAPLRAARLRAVRAAPHHPLRLAGLAGEARDSGDPDPLSRSARHGSAR